MALIECHECGHKVSTSASRCPSCGAQVVVLSGKRFSSLSLQEKLIVVGVAVGSSFFIAWLLMLGLEWLVDGHRLASKLLDSYYWWMFPGLAFILLIEMWKAYDRGEFNG